MPQKLLTFFKSKRNAFLSFISVLCIASMTVAIVSLSSNNKLKQSIDDLTNYVQKLEIQSFEDTDNDARKGTYAEVICAYHEAEYNTFSIMIYYAEPYYVFFNAFNVSFTSVDTNAILGYGYYRYYGLVPDNKTMITPFTRLHVSVTTRSDINSIVLRIDIIEAGIVLHQSTLPLDLTNPIWLS